VKRLTSILDDRGTVSGRCGDFSDVRFEIFTAMKIHFEVFCFTTPFIDVIDRIPTFRGTL